MPRTVAVSLHALKRAHERWPTLSPDYQNLVETICAEVDAALDDGRYSVRLPRWAVKPGAKNGDGRRHEDRSLRFVWTEAEDRLYVVAKENGGVRVVTAIQPRDTLHL